MSDSLIEEILDVGLKDIAIELTPNTVPCEFESQNFYFKYVLGSNGPKADIYKVNIFDKKNKQYVYLVIKKAPKEHRKCIMQSMFENEIHFYTKVYPKLKALEEKHQIRDTLIPVPEFVASNSEPYNELVILRDLKYATIDNNIVDQVLDEDRFLFAVKVYGQFHAISFCLKHENLEEFQKLAKSYKNILETSYALDVLEEDFQHVFNMAVSSLNPSLPKKLIRKLQPYLRNPREVFLNAIKYDGEYGCFLHGECNPRNMMFNYKVSAKNYD